MVKKRYDHRMLKEIYDEPEAIRLTATLRENELWRLARSLKEKSFKRIYLTGCGSSYYAGKAGRYTIEEFVKIPSFSVPALEFIHYTSSIVYKKSMVICISQSGETIETIKALGRAKEKGAYVLGLTNDQRSTLARGANDVILTFAGEETGPGTKTVVTQMLLIYKLALVMAEMNDSYPKERIGRMLSFLRKETPKIVEQTLRSKNRHLKKLARVYKNLRDLYVVGSGPCFTCALQACNLIKENSFIHAEAFSIEEFRHGPMDNARKYAEWIANRYRNEPNIIWTMYPQAKQEFVPIVRELASGLKDGDGGKHMITVHPDPSPASSSFIHKESWLAFNMIQTCIDYDLIYRMVTEDYGRKPVKPVVMAEGGYEGLEFGKVQTPLDIRRQAYWSQLAGGHYSYGHNDNWSSPYSWKSWIDSPGSLNMLIFRKIITGCQEWWNLIPDQSIFAGGESSGYTLNVAARSKSGEWILAYLSSRTTVSIKLDKITVDDVVEASWIYPITGNRKKIGRFSNEGVQSFTTPEDWEDAVCFWKLGESNDLNEFLISHYLRYKLAISFKFLVG